MYLIALKVKVQFLRRGFNVKRNFTGPSHYICLLV